jgi:hypothetical protein
VVNHEQRELRTLWSSVDMNLSPDVAPNPGQVEVFAFDLNQLLFSCVN